jgi:hypothetical protein
LQVCTARADPYATLCRSVTMLEWQVQRLINSHPAFAYTVLPLLAGDAKVDEYVAGRDGAIVVLSHRLLAEDADADGSIARRIHAIGCRPLLVVVEESPPPQVRERAAGDARLLNPADERMLVMYFERGCSEWERRRAYELFAERLRERPPLSQTGSAATFNGSHHLSTAELVAQFEARTLPIAAWDHAARLRIVAHSLAARGYEDTIRPDGWLCTAWRAYKASIGHGHLWNYSLTRMWAELLWSVMPVVAASATASGKELEGGIGFDALWHAHPWMRNGSLHKQYYSAAALFTPAARTGWVRPDLPPAGHPVRLAVFEPQEDFKLPARVEPDSEAEPTANPGF